MKIIVVNNKKKVKDFENHSSKYKNLLVKYYMDNCMYCEQFLPEWKKTVSNLKAQKLNDLLVLDVNMKFMPYLRIPQVSEFPTIKILNKNGNKNYNGQLNEKELRKWIYKSFKNSNNKKIGKKTFKKRKQKRKKSGKTKKIMFR